MRYVYPAVFTPEEDGGFSVYFPDLEGCYTSGDDLKDAMYMANDVLAFTLYDYEKQKRPVPDPSTLNAIEKDAEEFVSYIACDTIDYQKRNNNKAVKKTLSIPEWMNEAAIDAGLNFSQVLQKGILSELGL